MVVVLTVGSQSEAPNLKCNFFLRIRLVCQYSAMVGSILHRYLIPCATRSELNCSGLYYARHGEAAIGYSIYECFP
jgi:hypothetical protein